MENCWDWGKEKHLALKPGQVTELTMQEQKLIKAACKSSQGTEA